MKKSFNTIYYEEDIKSNKFFRDLEQFKSSNNVTKQNFYPNYFNNNQNQRLKKNTYISKSSNSKKLNEKSNMIPLNKVVNMPESNINNFQKKIFNPQKNLNPTHMKFNNSTKKVPNQYLFQNKEKTEVNYKNKMDLKRSYNDNKGNSFMEKENIQRKKMGSSHINFYKSNNMNNLFPNINNINNSRENLFSINTNWMMNSQSSFPQQDIYNEFINNMIKINPKNIYAEYNNFRPIFDLDIKRKEEKLKKGQNQLILERLQKKYYGLSKQQNVQKTGNKFYTKNKKKNNNKRQHSAQDNIINLNSENKENKKEIKNSDINININKEKNKIQIDANYTSNNQSINENKKFNKTFNSGFNFKKNNNDKRKKEKIIFAKIFKYFVKRIKNNYLWVKFFNKKKKLLAKDEEKENIPKKNKSLDKYELYSKIIKKLIKKNVIYKNNKIKINIKKENIKYNTDNSELDEVKLYKRIQKKNQTKKSEYSNFINNKKNNNYKIENSFSSSDSDNISKNEPKFKGIFDNNKPDNFDINEKKENKRFNFKTTSNFFSKNKNNYNENKENRENTDNNKSSKIPDSKKEEQKKFNIENIINNVIENNKKAAAARSSTSFYNIGSNFMNNRMRSTKTNFYSSKDNKGGGFTGTKDTNFTKEQTNEGRYFKPNSLKLTLINPLSWRKHEEIWSNLVSLKLGLSDLEKYLYPPNDTDILVSSYLKMNPRIINFCSIQKINTSKTNNENNNFISFMIDDNIQNPRAEIKKWKEAYKRAIFRWHPDKLFSTLEEINFKNEQQKIELKKKSTIIINNMSTLYKNIIETLNKILDAKNNNEENK